MIQLTIIMHECTNWFPSAQAGAIAFPLRQKAPALPILSSQHLFDVISSNSLNLSLIVEWYILLIRHHVLFIQHVCACFFDRVFTIVIHQLKKEPLHELKGNRCFAAQSTATTRRDTGTADSSNKVRTIPNNILRGTLRYLQLLEPSFCSPARSCKR